MWAQRSGFKSHKERKEKELWNGGGGDGGGWSFGVEGKSCFGEGGDESFNFASHDAIIQNIFRKNFLKYLRIFSKNFLK